MKDKQFDKWTKMREKGKSRFMLINGLLFWGLPMFIVMTFFINRPESGNTSLVLIGINAAIWAIGGLAFGYFMWFFSERAYQRELKTRAGG